MKNQTVISVSIKPLFYGAGAGIAELTSAPLRESLYGSALKFTRDRTEADDLVQDVMLRAWRFRDTFDGSDFVAWMHTILRNTAINGYHAKGRRARKTAEIEHARRHFGDSVAVCRHTEELEIEERLDQVDALTRVRTAMETLPPIYRRAVEMADLEGLSYKEIAEAMDCPIGTVMSRIYRGRKALRSALAAEESEQLSLFAVGGER